VKRQSGFRVIWGPVRATDLPAFIREGMKASAAMRQVTFSFVERLVLVPVEIGLLWKYALAALVVALLLSGIGSGLYSLTAALTRGPLVLAALLAGLLAGTVATPLLLPWLPLTAFAGKGLLAGTAAAVPVLLWSWSGTSGTGLVALALLAAGVSSHLAMNFTGSTPFTAPTGVEKEMRCYLPVQLAMLCAGTGLWVWSGIAAG
jgi:hypothetical protein